MELSADEVAHLRAWIVDVSPLPTKPAGVPAGRHARPGLVDEAGG